MAVNPHQIALRLSGFLQGVRAATPVVLGYLPIGFAFGVLARATGLTVAEIALMSVLVYAGSAQFIGAGMISAGASVPAIISTTFLVNLRHLLMSAALAPSFRRQSPLTNSLLAYGITDETFAVNSAALQGRPASPWFVAGLHITSQSTWVLSSTAGGLAGQMAANTAALGLDFALPAMFIGLLMPNLQGEERGVRIISAIVAAVVAVGITLYAAESSWSIIAATVIAATVGVLLTR